MDTELLTWPRLPDLILNLIFKKLTCISDCLRFSAVCKSWFSYASQDYNALQLTIDSGTIQQPPLLLILPTKTQTEEGSRVYSVTTGKILDFKLHNNIPLQGKICYGSSYGWLAFTMFDSTIGLFNPFSGKTIQLPPLIRDKKTHGLSYPGQGKVVLSKNPSTSPDDYHVVALINTCWDSELAILKSGAKSWISVVIAGWYSPDWVFFYHYCDVIYHDNVVYAVNLEGKVISVDTTTLKLRQIARGTRCRKRYIPRCYLVKSTTNELLRIQLYLRDSKPSICKMSKLVAPESRFVMVDSLGDDALFLGNSQSTCIPANSRFSANNIYYVEDNMFTMPWATEMGTFNLQDGAYNTLLSISSEPLPNPLSRPTNIPQAIWITPTLYLL
ncbi:probable F-box protein At1g65740 [Lycium ferocissimum]|uniref:probable F-box protein At1g65740 n=1 Tax=Lycium ferocissimum TaxID=112874 RepID=UPI00281634BA|nr:probable F-box protein At1g65740 [Lycium ferocissimum]